MVATNEAAEKTGNARNKSANDSLTTTGNSELNWHDHTQNIQQLVDTVTLVTESVK